MLEAGKSNLQHVAKDEAICNTRPEPGKDRCLIIK
jgi:hypothetical protein